MLDAKTCKRIADNQVFIHKGIRGEISKEEFEQGVKDRGIVFVTPI